MKREEATKTLKGEAWICCSMKWNEALEMAIKALEIEQPKHKKCCYTCKYYDLFCLECGRCDDEYSEYELKESEGGDEKNVD